MKVLVCIPWFSPAYKAGGPVQSIKNLVESECVGIEYLILTGSADLDGQILANIDVNAWKQFCKACQVFYSKGLACFFLLRKIVKKMKVDVIYINGIFSFSFSFLPILLNPNTRIILAVRGMLHPQALSQKKFKKSIYLFFLRQVISQRKVEFHATDMAELDHIRTQFGSDAKVHVIQNLPRKFHTIVRHKITGTLRMVTVALISPMKNHLLVLKALAGVKGNVIYDIVGPVKDMNYWRACQLMIQQLPSNVTVNYHGSVSPADIEHFLHEAHLFICPSKSENFGHVFLEAFSAGLPVITSQDTPWKNLDQFKAGINVDLDEPLLKKAILYFVEMENSEFQLWSNSALAYGDSKINRLDIISDYEKMFYSSSC